jgi:hypothetical protein
MSTITHLFWALLKLSPWDLMDFKNIMELSKIPRKGQLSSKTYLPDGKRCNASKSYVTGPGEVVGACNPRVGGL